MSETLDAVRALAERGWIVISSHGYDELAADGILATEAIAGLGEAIVVEDYPDARRSPSVLALQSDAGGSPIHVVCGIPRGAEGPAVLITAYRPDPASWTEGFISRRSS